jgi:flavin reductase (DIM6/NTAB) family NADH-FMN oxidoreductase RutF
MKVKMNANEAAMKTIPFPVVLITCADKKGRNNIVTITYITFVNENPPIIAFAIRPEKYSSKSIKETKEFVINIPTKELLTEIDYCGTHSGKNIDKFQKTGLTPENSEKVSVKSIKECPINIECNLLKTIKFNSHSLFIGLVKVVHIDKNFLKKGTVDFSKINFVLTTFLDYREIGQKIGTAFKECTKLKATSINGTESLKNFDFVD